LSVEGHAGYRLGPSGAKDGVASHVIGLLTDLRNAAHDDVVNRLGIDAVAFDDRGQRLCGEVDRVPVLLPRGVRTASTITAVFI
jgi:hypothetical protein